MLCPYGLYWVPGNVGARHAVPKVPYETDRSARHPTRKHANHNLNRFGAANGPADSRLRLCWARRKGAREQKAEPETLVTGSIPVTTVAPWPLRRKPTGFDPPGVGLRLVAGPES